MPEVRRDPVRGLLNLDPARGPVQLARYLPSGRAADFVEHYWTVRWSLPEGQTFTSETLPYPSVHVVLEGGAWRIQGVTTGKFVRRLSGRGAVFGIKFKPGGFRPVFGSSVASLANRVVPFDLDLPVDTDPEVVEAGLARHLPAPDPRVAALTEMCDRVATDRGVVRVDQVVAMSGMSKRALERLFQDYVGVSPKWVIQRYRLFEAAERLSEGISTGADLAQELGYFDQAHFIRDFKAMVGKTPAAFARGIDTAVATE